MTNWLDHVRGAEFLKSLYRAAPPSSSGVRLRKLVLDQDGPGSRWTLDLAEFPDEPPSAWTEKGFNQLQIELDFAPLTELRMEGWGLNNVGEIRLDRAGGVTRVLFRRPHGEVRIATTSVDLVGMSPYLRGSDG